MSTHRHVTRSATTHGKQSEDEVDYVKVILVGVVSLVIFAGSHGVGRLASCRTRPSG